MPIRKLGKCAVVALAALLAALLLDAQEGKPPDPYDPQGSAGGTMTGKALTNKDWWPNQLDLEILHQNSLETGRLWMKTGGCDEFDIETICGRLFQVFPAARI